MQEVSPEALNYIPHIVGSLGVLAGSLGLYGVARTEMSYRKKVVSFRPPARPRSRWPATAAVLGSLLVITTGANIIRVGMQANQSQLEVQTNEAAQNLPSR